MKLVLLPHHNTLTLLQRMQEAARKAASGRENVSKAIFLPSYPLVCVLGRLEASEGSSSLADHSVTAAENRKQRLAMDALKAALTGAEGTCSFGVPVSEPAGKGESAGNSARQLILPLEIPFMESVRAAGFSPETTPHFVLGNWMNQTADNIAASLYKVPSSAEVPPAFRAFRLALMQTTPLSKAGTLSEAEQAASFSWKFIRPFWVKLH